MKCPALRITLAAVIISLIAALAVPAMVLAEDAPEADTLSAETLPSGDAPASSDAQGYPDSPAPQDPSATSPGTVAAGTGDASQSDAPSAPAAPVQYSSQSSASTRAAIEALLKARKVQFDKVTLELRRTINRLATDIRLEEAQGGDVTAEKAQLARARAALQRAYVLERTVTARYRAVVTAEDQRAQYERAKSAARTSTAQLVTVTKLLRGLVSTTKLLAVLQPLRSGADSA